MILLAVTAVAGGACAGDQTDAAPKAQATPSTQAPLKAPAASAASKAAVTIDTFRFEPDPLTIERGQAVTWSNNDAIAHTVTHDGGDFDMELADKGATASHTFAEAGTFTYTCTRHPGMAGSVIVR